MKINKSFLSSLLALIFIFGLVLFIRPKTQISLKEENLPSKEVKETQEEKLTQKGNLETEENKEISPPSLLAAAKVPAEAKLFLPLGLKDMSKYNLGELLIWKEPGVVECEPWGPGMGYAPCLPGTLEGDPPCPIFMDCDGDGHYWWLGEDCDENCPTCYKGSPFTTPEPDGRDQDCDGVVDDLVECVPQYGDAKPFGYTSDCQWVPKGQTNFILVNEGEMGKIPTDEIHCKKVFGECTSSSGGFGNCTVNKTPGYFVKGEGVSCGGGIWRTDQGDSVWYCGNALRKNSYKGQYGCGGPCDTCYPVAENPAEVCDACNKNSSFDYPTDLNGDGIVGGPWGLCHGYSSVTCQEMTGCTKKITAGQYH